MESNENALGPSDVDFSGLLLGFSGAALMYMGETKLAPGENPTINMTLARQNIEIISLLADKTKGNLTETEQHLLQQILLDLRMRFIEKNKIMQKNQGS